MLLNRICLGWLNLLFRYYFPLTDFHIRNISIATILVKPLANLSYKPKLTVQKYFTKCFKTTCCHGTKLANENPQSRKVFEIRIVKLQD